MKPEGVPVPELSIPEIGEDDQGTIIIPADLVDFQIWEEDIMKAPKPRELFFQEDQIIPNEMI